MRFIAKLAYARDQRKRRAQERLLQLQHPPIHLPTGVELTRCWVDYRHSLLYKVTTPYHEWYLKLYYPKDCLNAPNEIMVSLRKDVGLSTRNPQDHLMYLWERSAPLEDAIFPVAAALGVGSNEYERQLNAAALYTEIYDLFMGWIAELDTSLSELEKPRYR